MAARTTEAVIETLVRDAKPVARLRPPMLRACLWLGVALAAMAAVITGFADMDMARRHARAVSWLVEMAGTLATGCLAVIAAFHLSLPDRSPRWALLPLPALALWLAGAAWDAGGNGWWWARPAVSNWGRARTASRSFSAWGCRWARPCCGRCAARARWRRCRWR